MGDGFLSGTQYTFRLAQLRAVVSSLCVEDIYEGQHILQWAHALDGVGGGEDVAATLLDTCFRRYDKVRRYDRVRRYDKVRRYDRVRRCDKVHRCDKASRSV